MRITESSRGARVVRCASWFLLAACVALLAPALSFAQGTSATTTTIVVSPTTITLGDTVTFTATVTAVTGTPTGLVTFFDGTTLLGNGALATVAGQSQASFSTSLLPVAASPHSILAVYQGDATHSGSDCVSTPITVNVRTSTTGLVLNPTTVVVGQPSTATVTVTDSGSVPPGTADTFTTTGAPITGRTGFTATLFADGLLLVAGGTDANNNVLNTSEIYSVSIGAFSSPVTQPVARTGAVAVLLPNGKVLIAGGSSNGLAIGALNTAELFDPSSGFFTATSQNMTVARFGTTATLLNTGKVLLAGGVNLGGVLNTAELYDPATDTFSATGNLNVLRTGASATLLGTGKVLIAGGSTDGTANGAVNTAELFDPAGNSGAGTFTAITGVNSTLSGPRWQPEAALLPSGKVLIAGGQNSGGALASADLYDPVADTFTASNRSMSQARANGSAVTLPNGMVLLAGGTTSQAVDLYDADIDVFHSTGSLQQSDTGLVPVLLNNGEVLVVGLTTAATPASDAELYAPSFNPLGTVGVSSSEPTDSITGACTLTPSTSTASTCTSNVTPANVAASPHTIAATYPADAVHSTSNNTASLTVNKANTTTTVTSSFNLPVFGQSVTFTATVSPVAPGSGTPTGTVTFLDGGSPIGTGTLSGGIATFTTSALAPGNHTITTNYGGDGNFNGSTGSLTNPQLVIKDVTNTTVTANTPNPSVVNQAITISVSVAANAPGSGTPTGTVFVSDGVGQTCTVTLSSAAGSCSLTPVAAGTDVLTASYSGDANFNGSTSAGVSQTINKTSTTTTVMSSVNPSVFGQSATFTATVSAVAPGAGTPTGTVTFLDGGSPIGTGTLSGGIATFATSALAVGNHAITTSYGDDGNFNGSTGSLTGNPQVVNKTNTTTTVTSSVNPSIFGQSATFTATVSGVAPGAGTPTGTVTFLDGGSPIGTGTLSGGIATFATSALAVGNHTITTNYGGDGNFNGSTGSLTGNPQVVNKANTATTVTSSTNFSVFGQSATFTATVSAVAPGAGTPTGTVTFLDGGSPIGTGTLSGSIATFTTSALAAGTHTITTSYGGDGNFNGSTGSLTGNPQVVNKDSTATTVTSSADPSVIGQSVTFTATVSPVAPGAGTPTGTVTFLDGGIPITGTLSGGVATFTTSALAIGNHTITTSYGGDGDFNGSTGSLTGNPQVVNKATTTAALSVSPNPAMPGNTVTFTATVSAVAPGVGTPTGTVTFKDGTTTLGTATLNASGVATFSTTTLTVGSHSITAVYSGDSVNLSSTSSAVTEVVQENISIAVASSANPSFAGTAVTFTATITGSSSIPTGTVTFKDGAATLGSATLNASGVGTFSTSSLAPGQHSITAVYSGDALNLAGTSGVFTQTVQENSVTTLTASADPALFGSSVTFTATVTASVSGAPTGSVAFKNGSANLGSATLNASGVATLSTSTLAVGTQSITAVYSGDAIDLTSTSSALSEVIQENTSVAIASSVNPSVAGTAITFTATVTGSASGTPTGTVTFKDGATTLGSATLNASGLATLSTSALTPGQHTITASYGGDSVNLSATSAVLTQAVQQNTSTALASSANPSFSGSSVTFTATVTAAVSGTPTGSVTFKDGATVLGTANLNASGVATFGTSTLSAASHTITAVYSGDAINLTSTSASLAETVNPANFTITANPGSQTITDGQSATFTLTVTPQGSFTTPINFSCTGLPLLANCVFAQSSITPNSSTVTNSLTITTVGRTAMLVPPSSTPSTPRNYPHVVFASLLAIVAISLTYAKKKRSLSLGRAAAFACLLLLVIGSMAACAGGSKPFTPTGMSQVQVTATSPSGSGNVSHTTAVTLTIQ